MSVKRLSPIVQNVLAPLLSGPTVSVPFDPEPLYEEVVSLLPSEQRAIRSELATTSFSTSRGGVSRWNIGWQENASSAAGIAQGDVDGAFRAIAPRYFFKSKVFRIAGSFSTTKDPDFEVSMHRLITFLILRNCLSQISCESINIVELGCGSAHNLLTWSSFRNVKQLLGADWSPSSALCIKELQRILNDHDRFYSVALDLNEDWTLPHNGAQTLIVTCHSLEQITSPIAILEKLAAIPKAKILNIEPVVERYRTDADGNLLRKLHHERKFLRDLETSLRSFKDRGHIGILDEGFIDFGSVKSEPYSWFFWQPRLS